MAQGDRCLLSSLYVRYFCELRAHVSRRLGSTQEADDMVHDVFLRVLHALAAEDIEYPRAYLYQVTNSVLTDHFRRNQRRGVLAAEVEPVDDTCTPGSEPTPEEVAIGEEAWECLCRVISKLPPKVRQAMILRKIDGLSYREVADAMGISVRTVEKHLARAATEVGTGFAAIAP